MSDKPQMSSMGRAARRGLRAALSLLALSPLLVACAISTPYQAGPARDAAPAQGAVIIVVTEATLGPEAEARDAFGRASAGSGRSWRRSRG